MNTFIEGNLYTLHCEFNGKVTDHYSARFKGYKEEHEGAVKLAVFVAEMDGEEVDIDTDFIDRAPDSKMFGSNWTITPHSYE